MRITDDKIKISQLKAIINCASIKSYIVNKERKKEIIE